MNVAAELFPRRMPFAAEGAETAERLEPWGQNFA